MDIPVKEYPRPTIKEILDFAHGEPTREHLEDFVSRFGYMGRLPVYTTTRRFSLSQLPEHLPEGGMGLSEDIPGVEWDAPVPVWSGKGEGVNFWRREWTYMHSFEEFYAAIMTHPSERRVPDFGIDTPEGFFTGGAVLSPKEVETVFVLDDDPETAELRRAAARVVAYKLNLCLPLSGYDMVGGHLVHWKAGTLLYHIWSLFLQLLSGTKEAKRCLTCGRWEEKVKKPEMNGKRTKAKEGEGYERSSWVRHVTCGNREYQRDLRRKLKGKIAH